MMDGKEASYKADISRDGVNDVDEYRMMELSE
jgi:hypothetical protein